MIFFFIVYKISRRWLFKTMEGQQRIKKINVFPQIHLYCLKIL